MSIGSSSPAHILTLASTEATDLPVKTRPPKAIHREGREPVWTCSSPIEEASELHINHVLMYTSLISQAVTCCQQVLLTQLFRAVMRSREQSERKCLVV